MPPRKKITPKEAPRRKTTARVPKFERFTRGGKRAAPRPQSRNSSAR
jgi:hypothetical protein